MARLSRLIGIAAAILAGSAPIRAQELGADPALATAMDGGYFISSVAGGANAASGCPPSGIRANSGW